MKLERLVVVGGIAAGAFGCSNPSAEPDYIPPQDASYSDVAPAGDASDATTTTDGAVTGCGAYKVCEDFESYAGGAIANSTALGPWKANVSGVGVVFQVDGVKAYAGTKSLHITVPNNVGQDGGTSTRATLNQAAAGGLVPGNNLFGRAMVFYSDMGGNGLPLGVHSWLFNSAGKSTIADGGVSINMGGGGAKMQLNYQPVPPLTEQSVQGGTMTAGAWHCVQWEYDGSGSPPNDEGKVWVDGVLAVDAPKTKLWDFATPWASFDFGFTHYQALPNGVDLYLDNFALDGAMIPCPP
jgi:hypothetical protein